MKKFLVAAAAILLAVTACCFAKSAEPGTVTIDFSGIGKFDRIDVSSAFKVNLSRGDKFSVVVTADKDLEKYIDVRVRDGKLIVKLDEYKGLWRKKIFDKGQLNVDITMPVLKAIDLSGATALSSDDVWEFPDGEFEIELSGASKAAGLKVRARSLDIDVSGAVKLSVEGKIEGKAKVDVSGASNVTFAGEAKSVDVDCSGASKVALDVYSGYVSLDTSGASKIVVKGHIDELHGETSGASKIDTNDAEIGKVVLR